MTRCLVLAVACGLTPDIAAAQSAKAPENPRPPAISVSVAAGRMQHAGDEYSLIVIAGAQFSIGRFIRFDAEAGHSAASNLTTEITPDRVATVDEWRLFVTSANILFRAGTRRFGGFAGGGFGVHRVRTHFDEGVESRGVPNGRKITVIDTRPGMQIVGGTEMRLTGRLDGFAAFRLEFLPRGDFRVRAGVRVTLKTMQTTQAGRPARGVEKAAVRDGQEVRVTMRWGNKRSGRFVSLSPSELVLIRGGKREQVSLADVRLIETVSHNARRGVLIGLVGGIGTAFVICKADDNFCGDDAGFGLLSLFYGGLGAGIGTGLGAMINVATADRHVVFESQPRPAAQITPILGNGQAGAALTLRWKTP